PPLLRAAPARTGSPSDAGVRLRILRSRRRPGTRRWCPPPIRSGVRRAIPRRSWPCVLLFADSQDVALHRQRVAPPVDQSFVGVPDRADAAIEIAQAERIGAAVVLAKAGVPVHLIDAAVPGESEQRDAVLLEQV